jgi:hypothetical protein
MLIFVGGRSHTHPVGRIAKLSRVAPIPASGGKRTASRLNRGGNRQANAALYRVAIVRMCDLEPTLAYVKKKNG